MGVPKEVCMSKVDTFISVEGRSLVDGAGKRLSESQLSEVVAVYNAWRVGNLQDCTVRGLRISAGWRSPRRSGPAA